MWFPDVSYEVTSDCNRLRLRSYDGSVSIVAFKTVGAARLALRPGRAELDCVAIGNGFLPLGARLVSRRVAANSSLDKGNGASTKESQSHEIDRDRDALARDGKRADSNRYDDIAGSMAIAAATADRCGAGVHPLSS